MTLSVSLLNALSGLQTNQNALQVVSTNIANVNSPDYSRKVHEQQSRILSGVGSGVETAGIVRKVDEFLQQDLVRETAVVGGTELRTEFFQRIQTLFGSVGNDTTLGNAITDFAISVENLVNSPEMDAARFTAMSEAQNVAFAIQDMASGVQELRAEADRQISTAVDTINDKLVEIAELNTQITQNKAQGIPTGDLEDRRDAAIEAVAGFMAVNQFETPDGQIILLSREGRSLVSRGTPSALSYTPSGTMTAAQTYPTNISGILLNGGADLTTELSVGKLAALIEMRDQALPSMTAQLDQLAGSLRDNLNRIHNRGANTPFGLGTGAGDAPAMLGHRTIADPTAAVTLDSTVTAQILDANGAAVGGPLNIPAGATTTNAIVASLDAYLNPGPLYGNATLSGGRLQVHMEPGFRLAIQDNGLPANAGDTQIDFDTDGDGTDESYLGFSGFFGLNDLFVTPELNGTTFAMENQGVQVGISSTIQVRDEIRENPEYFARGVLRGTPPGLRLGAGDNTITAQLADAFNTNFDFAAIADGPAQATTTFSGYAGNIRAFNAAEARDAEDAHKFQTFFFENLQSRIRSESGVNLDEELSHMVVLQNAYSASARVVQTTNELFDVLVNLV
jgi:flagellar hook-associated protein 1 FlgK